ncbi:hypothetical protein TNCV_5008391 [Trichonephila clavipes]|nr:hypothetical protein TNCV_5008391 [Trichonephila clavipes]
MSPVWCSRSTAGVHLAPCHEFRGPRSDYVRQVALETTTAIAKSSDTQPFKWPHRTFLSGPVNAYCSEKLTPLRGSPSLGVRRLSTCLPFNKGLSEVSLPTVGAGIIAPNGPS